MKANDVKASNVTILSAFADDLQSTNACTNGAINGICIGVTPLLLLPLSCLLCVSLIFGLSVLVHSFSFCCTDWEAQMLLVSLPIMTFSVRL